MQFFDSITDHFKQEHYPCEHPECIERRFVVFPSEQQLKMHTAREHGQSLTRAEKKQALTLPIAFNVRNTNIDNPQNRYDAIYCKLCQVQGRSVCVFYLGF